MWSNTSTVQEPCKASASRSRTPSPLGTTAALPNEIARPMTPHLAQLHDDLCKFHATHGDDAIPKRSKDVTPEEFSLANRLEKLRRKKRESFIARDSAFIAIRNENQNQYTLGPGDGVHPVRGGGGRPQSPGAGGRRT